MKKPSVPWVLFAVLIVFVAGSQLAFTADVQLVWDSNREADFAGYKVYYGTKSGVYGFSLDVGNKATYTFKNLAPGTYFFAVTAYNTPGLESEYSNEVTITLSAGTAAPIISSVFVSGISGTAATVNWTTDKASDSQVYYGIGTSYSNYTALNPALVTSHTQALSGLTTNTLYRYHVRSRDAAGNQAISGDFTFNTGQSTNTQTNLLIPRILLNQLAGTGDGEFTGVAISNLDSMAASFRFTAFDGSGTKLAGTNLTNPISRDLQPGEQLPKIDSELFGAGILNANSTGMVQVFSPATKTAGFFMNFNTKLTHLDGADFTFSPMRTSLLPEIPDRGYTKLVLINPDFTDATVILQLVKSNGYVRAATVPITVRGNGTFYAELYSDIFAGTVREPSDFIRIVTTTAMLTYQVFGEASKDNAMLSGQDTNGGATTLYSPQYVVGGPWRSTLSLINLDPMPDIVTLRLFRNDGLPVGSAKILPIPASGKILISEQAFFDGTNPSGQLVEGYLEIASSTVRLTGSVVFGDINRQTFTSALPLVSVLRNKIVVGHLASSISGSPRETWFTGIAILNPNSIAAKVIIERYSSAGRSEASVTQIIPARQRKSQLLTEIFPELKTQDKLSGYLKISVDAGVACFALFGTNDLSVLSAIPAQAAP